VPFEFSTEQVYLLVFSDLFVDIYRDGVRESGFVAPWTTEQLRQINWTQSADTLLVVHPDVPPKKITRTSAAHWDIADWQYVSENDRILTPYYKFSSTSVTLQPSATSGEVSLSASAPIFIDLHVGCRFRIENKEVQITAVLSPTLAKAATMEALRSTKPTRDWTEQSFSPARGWPASVCFHQDRLVLGGSRDLPNYLWLSCSDDLFNFDLGEGLDDQAIEFPLLSDQVNAIRHVFSGRHLQIFTSGAEWMVSGDPLVPTNIQIHRQTRIGSALDRSIPPRDVDGATMFIPRTNGQLREFLFADTEQAYRATDLAMVAPHVLDRPVDMDYDASARLLHIVLADGRLATLTVYRDEEVSAWTIQETDGRFLAIANVGDETYFLVERRSGVFIEMFDAALHVDAGLRGGTDNPTEFWAGADHLEGEVVKVVADGSVRSDRVVSGGGIELDDPASTVQLGLAFTHEIEPLPFSAPSLAGASSGRVRPITVTFRFWQTAALRIDAGQGFQEISFKRLGKTSLDEPPKLFSGDRLIRAAGWRKGSIAPLWRIEQDTPLPFSLLSVAAVISVNR
jgi:hypothetical protein